MNLYIDKRGHTIGLPWWFVPIYALCWALFATLALMSWVLISIAIRAVLLVQYLRAKSF